MCANRSTAARRATLPLPILAIFLVLAASAAAAEITKGPYVLDVRPDGGQIVWESAEGGDCSVAGGPSIPATHYRTTRMNACDLTGLAAGAEVAYRIRAGDATAEGSFVTAPPPGRPFSFVVIGDTQEDLPDGAHESVIRAVRALPRPPDLYLNAGDIVHDGDSDADWARFFDVEHDLLAHAVFVPAIGNHDAIRGQPLHYLRYFRGHRYGAFRYGSALFVVIETQFGFGAGSAQYREIKRVLEEAQDDPGIAFRFVLCHKPPVTAGHHLPNVTVLAEYVPLFERNRVDAVFNGHNHGYEHGRVNGIHYVVTGGGGGELEREHERRPWTIAIEPSHHFCRVDVGPDAYTVTAIRSDGSVIESFSARRGDGGRRGHLPMDLFLSLVAQHYYNKALPRVGGIAALALVAVAGLWLRRRRRARSA